MSSTIKRPKGASAARVRGVLMVKILYECILSILVYNLFYRQTVQYFHTPVYWLSGSFLATDNDISLNKLFIFPIYTKDKHFKLHSYKIMVKKGLGHKFLNLITALPGIVLFFTHIHDSIILWEIPYI